MQVVEALIDGMTPEEDAQDRDVDSRVSCTRGLGAACLTLMQADDGEQGPAAVSPSKAFRLIHEKVLRGWFCLLLSRAAFVDPGGGSTSQRSGRGVEVGGLILSRVMLPPPRFSPHSTLPSRTTRSTTEGTWVPGCGMQQ